MGNPYAVLKEYEGRYLKYPRLCEIIGEEKKISGTSKIAHLNRIKEYVDLTQDKGKIYIGRVYDSDDELQIIDNRNKFTVYIKQFLLNLFYQIERNTGETSIVITNRDILEMTYMVNNNYFIGKNAPYKYLDCFTLDINEKDIPNENYLINKIMDESDIFFSSSYRLLKRIIYNSLKQLEDSSLITKGKTFRLYKNETDENGVFRSTQHNCDKDEINRILSVQYDAVAEFNEETEAIYGNSSRYRLPNIQCVHYLYPSDKKRFYKILNRRLKAEFKEEGWNAYSTAWEINFAQPQSFEHAIRKVNYQQLNQNVQDKLLNAKDLSLIENTLKEQFVDTFIKT